MPKTVRYYIHKSGEEPIVRSVPVASSNPPTISGRPAFLPGLHR
jgi:hypothetical protein